ncbi:class I ribonucleotide reductase maintenance protein YfaE [Pseudidiomarina taiwanensis]|uniref:(Fe-S)-binding protein n=1 Tax=Pseudidiomarina taiwanensis TaxID=337250 RepID=A0A432ZN32_9GAMM|nr:class I ribonucleotide reductase maintenance protein YfaE [Pseudidiomarina taiwanensis]RUO79271.1 (Fe-S)-binding protein [Pseudidiomarina taiwanensis]
MSKTFKVTINGQHSLTVSDSDDKSLLESLEAQKVQLHYHCREGFCGACRSKLVSGDVTYINEPLAFVRPGDCLPCCCVPASDLELEH